MGGEPACRSDARVLRKYWSGKRARASTGLSGFKAQACERFPWQQVTFIGSIHLRSTKLDQRQNPSQVVSSSLTDELVPSSLNQPSRSQIVSINALGGPNVDVRTSDRSDGASLRKLTSGGEHDGSDDEPTFGLQQVANE